MSSREPNNKPKHILKKYEVPLSWGLLVNIGDELKLVQQPTWIDALEGARLAILQKIAMK